MSDRSDNPGVRVPPPVFYAAAVIGGWLLDRRWPLRVGDGITHVMTGWMLIAAWVALMSSSIRLFWRRHTSIIPVRPAMALVTEGPYRFTRNPMYVGLAMLVVAFGLLLNTWWPMLLLFLVLPAVQHFVIIREEQYLHRRFGTDYDEYMRRVRRWL